MRVYAVAFCANGTYNISQEAYSSLEAAQRFVESRRPNPKKVSEMFYQDSEGGEYFIHGLLHLLSLKLRPGHHRKTVSVNGKHAPLAGLLGVAHMMIDVTDIPCEAGDRVTLNVNPLLIHPAVPKVLLSDAGQIS